MDKLKKDLFEIQDGEYNIATFAPDYYTSFKCIADKCLHSCCIGWEIDIDEKTLDLYKNTNNSLGEKLLNSIDTTGETACFRMDDSGRCPFLTSSNLCEIILDFGEDKLCQICTDHPRFRNYFDDRTEIGVGMCCESAANLILNQSTPMKIVQLDKLPTAYSEFEEIRNQIFSIVQNRNLTFGNRLTELKKLTGIITPTASAQDWAKVLIQLEQLDSGWTALLNSIICSDTKTSDISDIMAENLLCYFIYRHFSEDDHEYSLRFAVICTEILLSFAPFHDFHDLCRMFSAEIEYSEENTDYLMYI